MDGSGTGSAAPASGPTSTDTHVNRIIGAIHPFKAWPQDPRMCGKCGMTRSSHTRSFSKSDESGWMDPGSAAPEDNDPEQAASSSYDPCPNCSGTGYIAAQEAAQNNNYRTNLTPPSPMLDTFESPNDESTDPMLQGSNDVMGYDPQQGTAPSGWDTPDLGKPDPGNSAGFHEPIGKTASTGRPQRAPRGQESGEVGEWVSPSGGIYHAPGELADPQHISPWGPQPREQDGPVFGTPNPAADPNSAPYQWGTPDKQDNDNAPGSVHNFNQCPQCGVGVDGSETNCPNPWCGHNLANDGTSSYDDWEKNGAPIDPDEVS